MLPTRFINTIIITLALGGLSGCKSVETVPFVEVERYMGLWYQISAYETSFNQGLVGVTAEYTLLEDGSVQVYNRGFEGSLEGPIDEILGNAVVVDEETNSRLKVSFPGVPNFPFANYLIVILEEENYSYAVVTDPLKYTLFVLSRTPQMNDATYAAILAELEEMGINTEKLLLTEQPIFM
ncbi:MAG: lipocalin family protein [Pseudomonadales bacterium]|nr:lipocalin family protein [Pseudomonadales bacterium]